MTNTPSPTDEELIERGRRMAKAMYQYEPDHAPAQLLDKIIDRLEFYRSDRAKLQERVSYLALRVVSLRGHGLRCKCGECVELDADINRSPDRG